MIISIFKNLQIKLSLLFILCLFSLNSVATVNKQTGEYSLFIDDFIGVQRGYHGNKNYEGVFGKKWFAVYDVRLDDRNEENVMYMFDAPLSRYHKFVKNNAGNWEAKAGKFIETEKGFRYEHKKRRYEFNAKGYLTRFRKNTYIWFNVEYDENNHMSRLVTYDGNDYLIDTNDDGRITHFRYNKTENKDIYITYSYNDKGLLIGLVDHTGINEYRYDEDSHLTYASFVSKPPIFINYQEFDGLKHVSKVSWKNTHKSYDYKMLSDSFNEKKYMVAFKKVDAHGDETKSIDYKFNEVYKDGEYAFTKRIQRFRKGTLVYDQTNVSSGIIDEVKKRSGITKYFYQGKRIIRKDMPNKIISKTYNDAGKVTYFEIKQKFNPDEVKWSRFSYDSENKLIYVENDKGQTINIQHNNEGDISVLSTKEHTLYVSHNDHGKVSHINIPNVGGISLIYDIHGGFQFSTPDSGSREMASTISRIYVNISNMMKGKG